MRRVGRHLFILNGACGLNECQLIEVLEVYFVHDEGISTKTKTLTILLLCLISIPLLADDLGLVPPPSSRCAANLDHWLVALHAYWSDGSSCNQSADKGSNDQNSFCVLPLLISVRTRNFPSCFCDTQWTPTKVIQTEPNCGRITTDYLFTVVGLPYCS
jgi:hypothetical protein